MVCLFCALYNRRGKLVMEELPEDTVLIITVKVNMAWSKITLKHKRKNTAQP